MVVSNSAGHSTPDGPLAPMVPNVAISYCKASKLTEVVPSRACRSQRSSPFVRLPGEIKLIILRHLLVRDKPISTRTDYEILVEGAKRDERGRFVKRTTQKQQVQGYNLSPAILRTCQRLFADGLPILYGDNTLEVCVGTAATAHTSWSSSLRTLELAPKGQFNKQGITARMSIFENQHILQCGRRNDWTFDNVMIDTAQRFSKYLIKANYNPDILHVAQLRSLLRRGASIFAGSNAKLVINWNSPYFPEPLPYNLAPHQLRTIKAFTLLRCKSFQLLRITDPDAIAVGEVITKCPIDIDLEQYLPTVCSMLEILITSKLFTKPTQQAALLTLITKLIEAVANCDILAFLQARHESMSIWHDVVKQLDKQKDRRKERYHRKIPAINNYHVIKGAWGYDVEEDGSDLHHSLWYVARDYGFKPDYDFDARKLNIVL